MLPMRTSSIFKSRWMALIWSAGIIWFAVDVAGSQKEPGNEADVTYNNMDQSIRMLDSVSQK